MSPVYVRANDFRVSAMSTALKQAMTADEFLLWAEAKEGRWEPHDGAPVMMSPELLRHNRMKFRAAMALQETVSTAGLPCEVFTDGVAIKIDARTSFEPDASVVCGPRRSDDAIAIDDPIIVVEVVSKEDFAAWLAAKKAAGAGGAATALTTAAAAAAPAAL